MSLNQTTILIKKAAHQCDQIARKVLSPYDLSFAQIKVLKYIYEHADEDVRITDLEIKFSMAHPTVIGIIQALNEKGLVQYRENPHDGRSRYIIPTDDALMQKDTLLSVENSLENKLTNNLTESEKLRLINLLGKMIKRNDQEMHS